MAGPTASVIIREPLSAEQRSKVADLVSSKASQVEGMDFWVNDRPFLWSIGEDYPGELAEEDLSELIGWQPQDQVIFAAMCNDQVDHRILAELCIEVARLLDGLVDFGGWLGDLEPSDVGQLWASPYESISGPVFSHLGTPEFLAWWLKQPNFRMVK
ncbi:MAG: hypothetical protein COA78_25505 [Blastopirellula sp.]|nr:MAG: hypothetical protein COA78_25505 [Blastopirellula sp.]